MKGEENAYSIGNFVLKFRRKEGGVSFVNTVVVVTTHLNVNNVSKCVHIIRNIFVNILAFFQIFRTK